MFPEFKRQKISKCQTWRQATQVLTSKYNSIIRFFNNPEYMYSMWVHKN